MQSEKLLGEILLEENLLDKPLLNWALEKQKIVQKPLGEILIDLEAITEEDLHRAMAKKLGFYYLNPHSFRMMENKHELLSLIPEKYAKTYRCFPLSLENGIITVAIDNPKYHEILDQLTKLTKHTIRLVYSPESSINALISKYYPKIFEIDAAKVISLS